MQFDLPEDLNQGDRGGRLIPFGKYKGQPIEVLAQDDQYRDWLMAQDWFRSRFPQLVQIVVNNFGAPSETPEHNQMQARFLEPNWQAAFAVLCGNTRLATYLSSQKYVALQTENAKKGREWAAETGAKCLPDEAALAIDRLAGKPVVNVGIEFELAGVDVVMSVASLDVTSWASGGSVHLRFDESRPGKISIELKPTIGDDFPAVLRQMRSSGSKALIYRTYSGSGVDEDVFRKLFESQGIKVLRESEIAEQGQQSFVSLTPEIIAALKEIL